MLKNRRSSVVLLGALLALLSGCERKAPEEAAAAPPAAPEVLAGSTEGASAAPECGPATVEDLVGATWTVDEVACEVGCDDHTHVEEGNTLTFSKTGDKFDVHGRYETSGGALEPIGALNNEVRGRLTAPHTTGGAHDAEHWFVARIYLKSNERCDTPTPYDVDIAVCTAQPDSMDACKGDDQHGGYGHSHP